MPKGIVGRNVSITGDHSLDRGMITLHSFFHTLPIHGDGINGIAHPDGVL
jgi:hypothetical protein